MFKNNCLRRSRPLPIRKRRGRFQGIFTCTKVSKNTYMVRKNTYEYSTFFHLSTFLHHPLDKVSKNTYFCCLAISLRDNFFRCYHVSDIWRSHILSRILISGGYFVITYIDIIVSLWLSRRWYSSSQIHMLSRKVIYSCQYIITYIDNFLLKQSYHESWYSVIIRLSRILISAGQPWLSRKLITSMP